MVPDSKKHTLEIEIGELGDLPVKPPRRRLWDFIPNRIALFLIARGYVPKATPYEEWVLKSVFLRAYYNRFYKAVTLMNAVSLESAGAQNVAGSFAHLANAPGSEEVN